MIRVAAPILSFFVLLSSAYAQDRELTGYGKLRFGMSRTEVATALNVPLSDAAKMPSDGWPLPTILRFEDTGLGFDNAGKLERIYLGYSVRLKDNDSVQNRLAYDSALDQFDNTAALIFAKYGQPTYRRDPSVRGDSRYFNGQMIWLFKGNRSIKLSVTVGHVIEGSPDRVHVQLYFSVDPHEDF